MKNTISILIPCYNESKTLSRTLPLIETFFGDYYPHVHLVFVNDGSKDDTESVLQVFQKISSLNTKIISYPTNKGKGYAVKTGIQSINTDYTIMMDADLATDLSCIHETMNNLGHNDIIIGDRTSKQAKRNGFRKILGKVGQRCTQSILHLPFNDTQAGYKAFNKATYHIWNKMRIERWGFDFEFLYLAQKEGLKIHEQKIIRNEQKISRVTLQSYIDTFDELIAVRWYHSDIYNAIRNTNSAVSTVRNKLYASNPSKMNTPMSWALILLSGILLTSSTSLVAQYSSNPYSGSGYYAGGSTQTGTYTNSNIVRGSSNSRGSSVGRSTSYSPNQSGFNASGTNYANYNQNYTITGDNTSGYIGNYDYLYRYYYSGNSAGTSYHNLITGAETSIGTGFTNSNSTSTSFNEYNYISDDGSGSAFAFGSKYSVSSSQSRGSTTQYRTDCSGICSKGSSWSYGSGYTTGTIYSRNISNYDTGNYSINGTGFTSSGSSIGTSYSFGTSGTGYSYGSTLIYGSTYSYSTSYGSGVDGSGSIYEWGTYIRDSIHTGKSTNSGTNTYSIGTNGSGSCVYEYESENRRKRVYRTITNRFRSPNRNSYNYDYTESYEFGNSSSYSMKCDGGICGGCRECGPYSQGSKCVFKQPGKAVEYPTFVDPIYPYGSPTPGVDFLGTGSTYAVVCSTPTPPPSCPCGGTYPSCNTCGGGGGDYAFCGDGSKNQASEECDDGNTIDNDLCNNQCKKTIQEDRCGDGIVQTYRNEVCDDANNQNGDGCDNQCQREFSGTGSTGSDYLHITLEDPVSCGKPFFGSISTNKSISQVVITLEFRQSGVLKKTITFTPTSNNYIVDVSGGENYVPSGTYSVSLVGKVDSFVRSIDLGSIPIEHSCPENPNDDPFHNSTEQSPIEKFIHGVADLLPLHTSKIIPKTGADI